MASAIKTAIHHHSLLQALVLREIQNRYAGSVGGMMWALVHPLVMLGVYGVVFEYVFQVRVPTLAPDQPYILFVAVALWPWLAFQESVTRACLAVQNHASLVKKVAFPHELVVFSAVIATFLVHLTGFLLVTLALSFLGYSVAIGALPTVLITLLLLLLLSVAAGLLLGALQVFVKDVEHLLSQLLSVLFYATPILYSLSSVPEWLSAAMSWNPLVYFLEGIRWALLSNRQISLFEATAMVLATAAFFYLSRRFFLRLSPHFEDML